ncbi:helix-turn-helix transcriptional regulator [Lacticaseibacillus sp. GG6-2]
MAQTLKECKALVSFLGTTLTANYEVVLHWIDAQGSYYIAAIVHPEISGRNLNSPITGFALELVKNHVYETQDYVTNYKAKAGSKMIQGSTFFIKSDDGKLLGLLCINYDGSEYAEMAEKLAVLAGQPLKTPTTEAANAPVSEFLHASVEEIIQSVIEPDLLKPGVTLTQEKKVALCAKLDERGVFQIKGAISKVAKVLHVSEPSVYRYLKMINRER